MHNRPATVSCPAGTPRFSQPGLLHELREVELLAELVEQLKLGLEVVDVVLLVGEDLLEQLRLVMSPTSRM